VRVLGAAVLGISIALSACGDMRRDVIVERALALDAAAPIGAADGSVTTVCLPPEPCELNPPRPRVTAPECPDGGCTALQCPASDPCQPDCRNGCTRTATRHHRISATGAGGTASVPQP